MQQQKLFGLIGYPLGHSFSKRYFQEKFQREGLHDHAYELFELEDIHKLPALLCAQPTLRGLNVTIPHKQTVIPLLDELTPEATGVKAVNCIAITPEGKLLGQNTDIIGLEKSLNTHLGQYWPETMVLGTGGAAAAAIFILKAKGIPYIQVSRKASSSQNIIDYQSIDAPVMERFKLIINCTPLGMHPKTEAAPPLPYALLSESHFCFDMVYNPAETQFMKLAKAQGAGTCNGLGMLYAQADAAFDFWNGVC